MSVFKSKRRQLNGHFENYPECYAVCIMQNYRLILWNPLFVYLPKTLQNMNIYNPAYLIYDFSLHSLVVHRASSLKKKISIKQWQKTIIDRRRAVVSRTMSVYQFDRLIGIRPDSKCTLVKKALCMTSTVLPLQAKTYNYTTPTGHEN